MRCGAQRPRKQKRGDGWWSEAGKGIENAENAGVGGEGWQLTSR